MRLSFRHVGIVSALIYGIVSFPTIVVAGCYDLIGCSDKNDFARHFGRLSGLKDGRAQLRISMDDAKRNFC